MLDDQGESEEFINRIQQLRRGGPHAAPRLHKPLLLLGLLRRYGTERFGPVTFSEIAGPLTGTLTEFGPAVKSIRAHYPFWRLQRDGIWEVQGAAEIPLTESGDPNPAYLDNAHPGQFLYRFDRVLREDKDLVAKAKRCVLVTFFDPALHERLREAVARVWG